MENSEELKKKLELIKENCIFCKIIKNEVKAYKYYEDEDTIAILDINPVTKGHTLLVPKEHFMIFPMVPDDLLIKYSISLQKVSNILKEKLNPKDIEIFIANGPAAGQQSNHFLFHIIPKYDDKDNITLKTEDIPEENKEELEKIYKKLVLEFNNK